jgi:hypothetical protein
LFDQSGSASYQDYKAIDYWIHLLEHNNLGWHQYNSIAQSGFARFQGSSHSRTINQELAYMTQEVRLGRIHHCHDMFLQGR